MKRFGNLYPQICSSENILHAHKCARKGKRHYPAVAKVDNSPDRYLGRLQDMLARQEFKNSPYEAFYKQGPKKNRWIHKLPYYPDRIVHHCVVQVLEPIWSTVFIRDTYSSLKGRGIHDGVMRMKFFLSDPKGTSHCLKMDIGKFYPSVDHDILKNILRKKLKCGPTLALLDEIIDSGEGVPIGNYLSQYFGNIYLSYFDHWMKEAQQVRYYSRYCDDVVVLDSSKSRLHELRWAAEHYLWNNLRLTVKPNARVFPVAAQGIDYLGYVFKHDHVRVRKSIVQDFKRKVRVIRRSYFSMSASQVINVIMSYYGWLKHGDARKLWVKYIDKDILKIISYVCHKNNIQIPKPLRGTQ